MCLTDMDCPCITLCKASRCSVCSAACAAAPATPRLLAARLKPASRMSPKRCLRRIAPRRIAPPSSFFLQHIFCKRCITLVINRDKPQCPLWCVFVGQHVATEQLAVLHCACASQATARRSCSLPHPFSRSSCPLPRHVQPQRHHRYRASLSETAFGGKLRALSRVVVLLAPNASMPCIRANSLLFLSASGQSETSWRFLQRRRPRMGAPARTPAPAAPAAPRKGPAAPRWPPCWSACARTPRPARRRRRRAPAPAPSAAWCSGGRCCRLRPAAGWRLGYTCSLRPTSNLPPLSPAGCPPAALRPPPRSQFTSFLDLVQPVLVREGFRVARLDGKTPAKRRAEVLRSFQSGKRRRLFAQKAGPCRGAAAGLVRLQGRLSLWAAN